jgi:putative flippase GtrA
VSAEPKGPKTARQFARFLVAGAVNTLFGYSVFAGLVLAGMAPMPALVLTYVVGIAFNYFTTGRYVFGHAGSGALLRFIAAYGVIYLFNVAIYRGVAGLGAAPLLAQALCLPVVAVFSFVLFKFRVFRDEPRPPG